MNTFTFLLISGKESDYGAKEKPTTWAIFLIIVDKIDVTLGDCSATIHAIQETISSFQTFLMSNLIQEEVSFVL
jgi:hypothetical protein